MDKLKPLLTHKFWILSFVALIVVTVGWYLGTGAQAAAIQARIDKLNGLSPTAGGTTPNDDWIEKATAVKDQNAVKVQDAAAYLWEHQKGNMVWPRQMREYVQDKTFDSELENQAKETYRRHFAAEVERLGEVVDPYDRNDRSMRWEGAVVLQRETLPLVDPSIWQGTPPSSKEIWYLQEDVWLLEALLQSVRDVNDRAGADSNIIKAPIKQISLIELRGGDRAALAAAGAAGGMAAGGMGSEMDAEGYAPPGGGMFSEMHAGGGGGFGMGSGMGGGMGGVAAGTDFNMDEEVGPATLAAVGAMGSMEGEAADPYAVPGEAGGGGYIPPADMGGGMGSANRNPLLDQKRYVDDGPELPYKTRAFKLSVVMDHRQIPEFLVELTNSPFPVNIERAHWAEMNPDPRYAGRGRGYGGGMEGTDGYAPPGFGGSRGSRPGSRGGFGSPMGLGHSAPGLSNPMSHGGFGSSPMGSGRRNPMGSGFGRSPMGGGMLPGMDGMDEYDGMGGFGGMGRQRGNDPYSQAMSDPFLAEVVVGGVMTLYRSPQDVQASVDEAEAGTGTATAPTDATAPDAAASGMTPMNGPGPMGTPSPVDPDSPPVTPSAAESLTPPADETLPEDGSGLPEEAAADSDASATPNPSAPPPANGVTAPPPANDVTAPPAESGGVDPESPPPADAGSGPPL